MRDNDHMNNIQSSNPRAQDIFLFLCTIFRFPHLCFTVSGYMYFTSLVKSVPMYFIIFDVI